MIALAFGAACTPTEPTATGDTGDAVGFEIVADQLASGILLGAWSAGSELIFVGGTLSFDGPTVGGIARYDGSTICVEPEVASATLWWAHGSGPDDWYAVGGAGTVLHFVDGVPIDESVPTEATLYGVWAAEDGRVWASGGVVDAASGEIWLREGGAWSLFADGLDGPVFKVWDRWFVGGGRSWHRDGDTLTEVPLPEEERLLTVRGRADDDVWAVGGSAGPALLHWDGVAWTKHAVDPHCTAQPLNGVWTAPGEDVWIAGNNGTMGRYDGTSWECPFPPISGEHFHAVWQHEGDFFWAGGNLFSTNDNYGTIGHHAAPPLGAVPVTTCPTGAR